MTDSALLEKLKGTLKRFRKDDLKTGKIEFEFFSNNIELGSYHRTIAIKFTNIPQGFFIEFSVPKYAKGNNVEMIHPHELPEILTKLYVELCAHMEYELPHFSTWPLYRLDVCYNWIFKDENEAVYAMDFLQRIDFPRKKKHTYDTSVMHTGSAYTIKFYAKGPEFKKHDFDKIETKKAVSLQSWANRIVRFEVSLRRTYLQSFLGLEKIYFKDIIDDDTIEKILKYYLEEKVFFYLNPTAMGDEKIKHILNENFTKIKATRLYQFYRDYYFSEEMKNMFVRGGLNRSTIYRYKKDLHRVGIGISIEKSPNTVSILEQLIIPSPTTRFDLIDYSLREV